jgi:hypothetical protein
MPVAPFEPLKLARALRDGVNFTPEQAEGAADAIAEAVQNDLATRADVGDAELRLGGELREAELRLDGRIEAAKAEVIKWMFGTIGFRRSLFSARSSPSCVW